MIIRILGSAAGGGVPQWNCRCRVCDLAWRGDPRVHPRTQSSIAVSDDDESWILLNASPDIRQQIAATPQLQPRQARHSPIAAVLLSNADVDHIAGLLTLRERQPFTIYATEEVLGSLTANPVFDVLAAQVVDRRRLVPDRDEAIRAGDGTDTGLIARAYAVPGKAPLYVENARPAAAGDTVGFRIASRQSGRGFDYIPGCGAVTDDLLAQLEGTELLLFDGTLWRDDEIAQAGVGTRTGRQMAHVSLSGPEGTLARFADARIGRKVLVHLNNTNPVLIDGSPEAVAVRSAGWQIAEDGMEFGL